MRQPTVIDGEAFDIQIVRYKGKLYLEYKMKCNSCPSGATLTKRFITDNPNEEYEIYSQDKLSDGRIVITFKLK